MAAPNKQCLLRLQKEYKALVKEPVPSITAHPSPSDLLEWHFVLEGAKGTDYEGGVYHGRLQFPSQYPFKPPSIMLYTPNGRFATNTKLCMSMTDYHPESWNPLWSVGTILNGLLSFMYDQQPTTGSINTSKAEKQRLASESLAFNCRNITFKKLFPDRVEQHARAVVAAVVAAEAAAAAAKPAVAAQQPVVVAPAVAADAPAAAAVAAVPGVPAVRNHNVRLSMLSLGVVVVVAALAIAPMLARGGELLLPKWGAELLQSWTR